MNFINQSRLYPSGYNTLTCYNCLLKKESVYLRVVLIIKETPNNQKYLYHTTPKFHTLLK